MASSLSARLPNLAGLRSWITAHDQLLLRIGVIGAVWAGAALLGRQPSVLPVLAVAGIAGVLIFYRWPELGLLLTLIGAMSSDWNGPSGLNIAMLGVALLLGLWLAEMLVLQRKFVLVGWSPVRAGVVLCLVGMFSFLFGMLPWFPASPAPLGAQLGGLTLVILAVGIFAWTANRVRSLHWLKVITFGFITFATLHIAAYFLPVVGTVIHRYLFPGTATGSMFWAWLAVLSFSQALYNRSLGIVPRIILGLVTAGTLYVAYVVQNDWKSGWVPAAVGISIVLALSSWRVALLMMIGALLPLGTIAQGLISSDAYSYSTRMEAWQILGEIIKVNPILGLGTANYYWYTPLFSIRGYNVNFNSHSQYVDLVAQYGLLGLLAFLWFMFEIGRVLLRLLRRQFADDFARAYLIGAAGGFVATLAAGFLGDWLFPFFYNVGMYGFRAAVLPWVFLGGLFVIARCNCLAAREDLS